MQSFASNNKRRFHLPDGPEPAARDAKMAAGGTDWSIETIGWLYGHDAAAVVDRLAPRQREVLALIGLGLRNREIGERLGISTRTVQKTVERILKYLGVPNRTQAAMIWIVSGRQAGPSHASGLN